MIVNESLQFQSIGFQIEKTKDESPTLRIIDGTDWGGESMHHSGGAFSETLLIYGQAFSWGFEKHKDPRIVSLGLGLGYVEVLACAYALKHNSSGFQIYSYESQAGLIKMFQSFYLEDVESETYQWILENIASRFELSAADLKAAVKKALQENRLQLLGDFTVEEPGLQGFDVFCYDAYSKKTSPQLWDEAWMGRVFQKGSAQACVSSYASNGALKRALAFAGYQFEILEGFQGKRNRTWGYRASLKLFCL